MFPQATTQASLGTQLKVWFDSLPAVTRSVMVVCVCVYVVGLFAGVDHQSLGAVCLSPWQVVVGLQVHRLVTALVFHVGLLHLAFNMLAFVPTAKALERHFGSVQFGYLLLLLSAVADVLYLTISFATGYTLGREYLHSCAVGLSGLVFGVIVVENHLSGASHRSIWGFFTVPARFYPWVLLLLWQLLMWGSVSFLGHLCGVLAGEAYISGYLDRLKLSGATAARIEDSAACSRCMRLECFLAHGSQLPTSYNASGPGDAGPGRGTGHNGSGGGAAYISAWLQSLRGGGAGGGAGNDAGGGGPLTSSGMGMMSPGGSSPAAGGGPSGKPAFQGKPYTLAGANPAGGDGGGSSGTAVSSGSGGGSSSAPAQPSSSGGTQQVPSPAKLAAAAEARMGGRGSGRNSAGSRGSGNGNGSGSSGGDDSLDDAEAGMGTPLLASKQQ